MVKLVMVKSLVKPEALLVADEAWCALASLHRDFPERVGFTAKEILARAAERSSTPLRPGVQVHIYQHNVANVPPSSARYRMFFRLPGNSYRLFLPGDVCDPQRKGKTKPDRNDLPPEDQRLLDFYENQYCVVGRKPPLGEDPLLSLRGVGRKMWAAAGGGENYIRQERMAWDLDDKADRSIATAPIEDVMDDVWNRIVACEGRVFYTTTMLPFTYRVDGNGIWPIRDERTINRKLLKTEIRKAVLKGKPSSVTELAEFIDSSYLFAILRDPRTCPADWK